MLLKEIALDTQIPGLSSQYTFIRNKAKNNYNRIKYKIKIKNNMIRNKGHKTRAAIFTLDAVFGVFFLLVLVSFVFLRIPPVEAPQAQYAQDVLHTLSLNDSFTDFVTNASDAQTFIDLVAQPVCIQVSAYNSSLDLQKNITKAGCGLSSSATEKSTAWGVQANLLVQSEVWLE